MCDPLLIAAVSTAAPYAGAAATAGGISAGTLATGSLIASGVGTALTAFGQYQQGRAQQAFANYNAGIADNNARIAEYQAKDAIERGQIEEKRHRIQVEQFKGSQRAALAGSGFDVNLGTPTSLVADTAELGELDALTIRANAEREAYGYTTEAANYRADATLSRASGKQAKRAGTIGAFSSILSGGSQVADKWYGYKRAGVL